MSDLIFRKIAKYPGLGITHKGQHVKKHYTDIIDRLEAFYNNLGIDIETPDFQSINDAHESEYIINLKQDGNYLGNVKIKINEKRKSTSGTVRAYAANEIGDLETKCSIFFNTNSNIGTDSMKHRDEFQDFSKDYKQRMLFPNSDTDPEGDDSYSPEMRESPLKPKEERAAYMEIDSKYLNSGTLAKFIKFYNEVYTPVQNDPEIAEEKLGKFLDDYKDDEIEFLGRHLDEKIIGQYIQEVKKLPVEKK